MVGDEIALAHVDGRRKHLHRIDESELAQVADMVLGDAKIEPRGALGARTQPQAREQVGRGLMTELGVELDVEMVVFIALPGVHRSAESRYQTGARHALQSPESVDGCPKWPKKPQKSTLFVL